MSGVVVSSPARACRVAAWGPTTPCVDALPVCVWVSMPPEPAARAAGECVKLLFLWCDVP